MYVRELMMCYNPVREAVDTTSYIDEYTATSPYIYRSGLVGESVKDVHRVLAIMVGQDHGQRSYLLTIVKHKEIGKMICIITYDRTMKRAFLVRFFNAGVAALGHWATFCREIKHQ